jgi:3-oxoacyl-[acyl-carrier-protein] synthase III
MAMIRSVMLGCGAYLPERIMTNHDLAQRVDTSDEWIVERTGIKSRHIAAPGEYTSDLAYHAARAALEHAGVGADELDMIVLATTTPDETFPATAVKVQARLGMTRGAAFDVQAVCSGFVYALAVADNFIKAGQVRTVAVIGAETFSRLLNWEDRTTCVLFGDGGGAVILRATTGRGDVSDQGVLSTHLHSDGRQHDLLFTDGGPSTTQTAGHVHMRGQDVFKHAVVNLADVAKRTLANHGLQPEDLDWLIPHQANLRIIEGTGRKLRLDPQRVVVTVDRHGNTSAASIPLALNEAVRDGRIKRGDLLLLEAMGGGLTWGGALVRW